MASSPCRTRKKTCRSGRPAASLNQSESTCHDYPIAIEDESGKAYGVQFPDLPSGFSAEDTLDEAISYAAEALAFHIEGLLDAEEKIPPPQAIETHSANPDYAGMI